jgi:hypothetical protein
MNITSWKEFRLDSLFDVIGASAINIEELNAKYGYGDYPYVTRTEANNGVSGFYDYKNVPANILTIETTLSGLCFYHDYEFSTGDHVVILKPKGFELNKYISLFIKTIWRKNSYKYGYGRPAVIKEIKKSHLILPADSNGKPNWSEMEKYIKTIETKIKFKPIKSRLKKPHNKVDMSDWSEFSFVDKKLWQKISHGQRLIEKDRIKGDIPYYSASEYNNGMTDRIDNPIFVEKNCIIYSTFGTAFWVENEFTMSDEIYAFYNDNLNKYNALFITTIMKQNQYKFRFGRKAFYNKFENEIIKLPTTPAGNPDWEYMEFYINSLPYSDLI